MSKCKTDILERLESSAAYMDEKSRDRFVVTAGTLHGAIDEIRRLREWVADLQTGMFVNCVYCGHRYGPGETVPVSMADALKAHIAQCQEHPMSELLKLMRFLREHDGECLGDHPDWLKKIDAAIAKAGGAP